MDACLGHILESTKGIEIKLDWLQVLPFMDNRHLGSIPCFQQIPCLFKVGQLTVCKHSFFNSTSTSHSYSFYTLLAQIFVSGFYIKSISKRMWCDSNPAYFQMWLHLFKLCFQRREIMACAPTGSGKTAAFILPILHHLREPRNDGIRALILSPTRELAQQVGTDLSFYATLSFQKMWLFPPTNCMIFQHLLMIYWYYFYYPSPKDFKGGHCFGVVRPSAAFPSGRISW